MILPNIMKIYNIVHDQSNLSETEKNTIINKYKLDESSENYNKRLFDAYYNITND